MPAASLTKVDTTSQSWLVLPKTQGITGYRCVCLSRAAQLQSWGLAVSLVSLSQACCLHRRHSCATSAFCAIEAVHRMVCWLTCYVRKDRRLNTDLRFELASKLDLLLVRPLLMGPTVHTCHGLDGLKHCTYFYTQTFSSLILLLSTTNTSFNGSHSWEISSSTASTACQRNWIQ